MDRKLWIKILAIAAGVLAAAFAAVFTLAFIEARESYRNPISAFETPESELEELPEKEIVVSDAETGEETTYVKSEQMVNILLLGIDSTDEREAQHKGYRSDVMMLCTFDMANNKLNMLSFPRDLWIEMYTMDTKTGEITGTTKNRINTAYSKGGGPKKFGAKNAMLSVENLIAQTGQLDIDVDYFVSLDIDALPKIAAAIGAVDVELNTDLPGLGKEGQVVTIDEDNIDDYIRNRKKTGGDYSRAERQQRYIIAAAKKLQQGDTVSLAISIYQKIASDIQTNLNLDQIAALAGFVKDFNMDELTRHTVEAKNGNVNGASVLFIKEDEFRQYLLENFYQQK